MHWSNAGLVILAALGVLFLLLIGLFAFLVLVVRWLAKKGRNASQGANRTDVTQGVKPWRESAGDLKPQAGVVEPKGGSPSEFLAYLRDLHSRKTDGTHPQLALSLRRLCQDMASHPSMEFVDALRPFLVDPNGEIRQIAGHAMAATGRLDALEAVKEALRVRDLEVDKQVIAGLNAALESRRLDAALIQGVWKELLVYLRTGRPADAQSRAVAKLLVWGDPEKAAEVLLLPEIAKADSPWCPEVIRSFISRPEKFPRAMLEDIMTQALARKDEDPLRQDVLRACAEILVLLPHQKVE